MIKSVRAKIYLFCLTSWLTLGGLARAQDGSGEGDGLGGAFQDMLEKAGQETGYKTGDPEMFSTMVSSVVSVILTLLGVIFLVMIIYSGIRWMTAGGREEVVTRAKDSIRQAIIGLIIVIGAYAISYFFFLFF